jgi:hypothetical protein
MKEIILKIFPGVPNGDMLGVGGRADGRPRRHLLPLKGMILGIFLNGAMLRAGRRTGKRDVLQGGGTFCAERNNPRNIL